MSLIEKKYWQLRPSNNYLADVTVLAQAWKKTHHYIRRHNWYANLLELDVSAFNLETTLEQWANEIAELQYQPDPLRLVPAPKNAKWEFRLAVEIKANATNWLEQTLDDLGSETDFTDWQPVAISEGKPEEVKLRPLAHVSIRDQTVSTAVMICLANAVESAQGQPLHDFKEFNKPGSCVSYGNRLHCVWREAKSNQRAEFAWGNSRTYSDYFDDYRKFLARPIQVCREWAWRIGPDQELFILKLDLQAFFDKVDRKALLRILQELSGQYEKEHGGSNVSTPAGDGFWTVVNNMLGWQWNAQDQVLTNLIREDAEALPLGLPQGLVASGFLANAYLIGFDRAMQQFLQGDQLLLSGVRLLDYCRYVDDLRVVISAPANIRALFGQEYLKKIVSDNVQAVLASHLEKYQAEEKLKLNQTKTELQPYRSMSNQGSVSALMQSMKAGLSGTFDLETLVQATTGLDGLLWLSEQLESSNKNPPKSRLKLAAIAQPANDMRDDTVKRFVATRLCTVLRERLAMADDDLPQLDDVELVDKPNRATMLAHEFENTARKLIKAWSENPSLVLLLRCGLDLFPHPKLLFPVIECLEMKLAGDGQLSSLKQVKVAQYVITELFKAAAVETGRKDGDAYPENVDLNGYRQVLASFAKRLMKRDSMPWYLLQQASFFLSSIGDVSLDAAALHDAPELQQHGLLQKVLRYAEVEDTTFLASLPLALIVQQLQPEAERFSAWFCAQMSLAGAEVQQKTVGLMVRNSPQLLIGCLLDKSVQKKSWRKLLPLPLLEVSKLNHSVSSKRGLPQQVSLLRAINAGSNPFANENAVLALAHALVSFIKNSFSHTEEQWKLQLSQGLAAEHIELGCDDWSRLCTLQEGAGCKIVSIKGVDEGNEPSLNVAPPWIRQDAQWLYGIGRILRSALTGEFDFTARRFVIVEDCPRYTGLRTTWFQRRTSLLNTNRALFSEPAPLTPWMSGFLAGLLQWPGTNLHESAAPEIDKVTSFADLLLVLEGRMEQQRSLYGVRSETPIYVIPTSDSPAENRPLRIAVVQTMWPKIEDFDIKDPLHWTPSVLAQHRRHIAEVCNLARAKVKAWASARPKTEMDSEDPAVDIVLFPELAVHPEHTSFLRRLSDQLKSHIFSGLTYVHSTVAGGPVNTGLWLVRTETAGDGRRIDYIWQGKKYPMKEEEKIGIKSHRPHLVMLELPIGLKHPVRVAAAICFDATDLALAADLRDRSDIFLVAAMNKDVATFDNMVGALNFHMYQPVILANSGEFGGSTAQAPFPGHEKMISHVHGANQVAVSVFEIEPWHFKAKTKPSSPRVVKSPPAGYEGRPK